MVRFRLRVHLHEYELSHGLTVVGRGHNCNLTIEDVLLSREHAALRLTDGRVMVRDLGSRNGTYVNGERIQDDVELHDGDRIRVGATEIVFSRVISARRTVATTASVTTCRACGSAYVVQAACCPRCGASPRTSVPQRSESQQRRDFWLSLEVELLDKAMAMYRYEEAEEAATRLRGKLDEVIGAGRDVDAEKVKSALLAMMRLARVRGTGRTIAWTLGTLRALALVPGPELFAMIAATPPIVLDEAIEELIALVNFHRTRDNLSPTEQSCITSLEKLADDVVAFGAMRGADTAPVSAVSAMSAVA